MQSHSINAEAKSNFKNHNTSLRKEWLKMYLKIVLVLEISVFVCFVCVWFVFYKVSYFCFCFFSRSIFHIFFYSVFFSIFFLSIFNLNMLKASVDIFHSVLCMRVNVCIYLIHLLCFFWFLI